MKLEERLFSISKTRDKKKRIIYFLGIRIRYRLRPKINRVIEPRLEFSKFKKIDENPFCTGCSACFNVCPTHAIKMAQTSEGFFQPTINQQLCIKCGKCLKACPIINAKEKVVPKTKDIICYAAQADDNTRIESASGGMFTVLANYVLSNGGYVCGATYSEDFRSVRHEIIDNIIDLPRLKNSKYVQSDLSNVFNTIKNLIEHGNLVLFVGTPCQIDGLKRYVGTTRDNLILVDLICCGVPSVKIYNKYLQETLSSGALVNGMRFRMKDQGWHSCAIQISSSKGACRIKNENCEYEQLHFKGISTNKICNFCPYSSFKREGDISLGDFWAIERYDPSLNDEKGTSLVFVNTKKGQGILKLVKHELKLLEKTPAEWTLFGNDNIINPITHRNRRQFFWNLDKMSLKDNYRLCMEDKCDCIIFNNAITEINYGSMLTAYALQELILSFGLFAKILNHARVKMDNYEGGFAQRFAAEYLNLTEPCETEEDFKELNRKTDTFIVGSDQMWRTCYWKNKVDKILLDFVNFGKRKIGCAISFGVDHFEGSEKEKRHFKESLKSFYAISVREDSGVGICENEFSVSAKWILDPVFIISQKSWHEMSSRSNYNCTNKLCYYGWQCDKKRKAALYAIAKKNKCDDVVNLTGSGISVEDWLSAIQTCKVFVSDSYHGICFAIIFHTPFICVSELGQSRFDSLAKLVNLKYVEPDDLENIEKPPVFDFDHADRILSNERKSSSNYLQSILAKTGD